METGYPLVEENLSNIYDSHIPKKYKAYYEGDQSLILTRSVDPNPIIYLPHVLPGYDPVFGVERLEYMDLNNTINNELDLGYFESIHTWLDLYSWPTNGIVIQNPPVKENYVDIPGGNGSLDFSESLTGYPLYDNRNGSISFEVDPCRDNKEITTIFQAINTELHGRKVYALVADDAVVAPDAVGDNRPYVNYQPWYYEGRVSIDSLAIDGMCPTWNLNYVFAPYKKLLWTTGEDSVWDAFDFNDGVFYEEIFKDIQLLSNTTKTLPVERLIGTMPTVPTITVTATASPTKPDETAPDLPSEGALGMYVRISDESGRTNKDTGWIFLSNGTAKDPRFTMVGKGIYPVTRGLANDDDGVTIKVHGTGTITFDMEIGVI